MNVDLGEERIKSEGQQQQQQQEYFYSDNGEIGNLRDLQNHFAGDEEPFGFVEYANFMKTICKGVKENLLRMQEIEGRENDDGDGDDEERKIDEE